MNVSVIRAVVAVYALVFVTALFFAFASCSPGQGASEQSEAALESSVSEAPATSKEAEPAAPVEPASYSFSLGFAGDICFADNYLPMQHLASLGSSDISDGIDPAFIELMRKMGLMWINNEFVYSSQGQPLDGKAWTFKADPAHVSYLNDLGIDIAGLANNHVFDYGEEAFLDTLDTIKQAKIPYVGAGRTLKEAMAPVILEIDGFRIAYVAASRAEYTIYTPQATESSPGILWCYDNELFLQAIRDARKQADFVVALPHWGIEHSTELEYEQIDGAHAYIDAGADAVIGAHTHILQGIEYYEGKPIVYSLGNFWFDDYDIDTMVAELRISGEREEGSGASDTDPLGQASVELVVHPGTQSGVYTKMAATPEEQERIFSYLEGISVNVAIDSAGVVSQIS